MESAEIMLAKTFFLVEGNTNEVLHEWARNRKGARREWVELRMGWTVQVGELDSRPINIFIHWDVIDSQLIAFWDVVSEVSDRRQITAWFEKNFHGTWKGRRATCDMMNFHLALHAIDEKNRRQIF